jgi:hypothetical protein
MGFNAAKKLYRKTDPSSSKEAAINNIEKINSSKSFVFKQLEKYQGLTSAELALEDRWKVIFITGEMNAQEGWLI